MKLNCLAVLIALFLLLLVRLLLFFMANSEGGIERLGKAVCVVG